MYRLFLALRYLRSRLVNLISVAGVMAGVAVLIIVVCIMDGFQERVRGHVRGRLSHIILTPLTTPENLPTFDDFEEALKAHEPHVAATAPQIRYPIFFQYETQRQVAIGEDGFTWWQMEAVGIDPIAEAKVTDFQKHLIVCRDPQRPFFVTKQAEARNKMTVLVSRTFAEKFGLSPLADNGTKLFPYGALLNHEGKRIEDPALLLSRARTLIGVEMDLMYGIAASDEEGNVGFKPSTPNVLIAGVYDSGDAIDDIKSMYMDISTVRSMLADRFDYSTSPPTRLPKHEYLQINVKLDDFEHADAVKARLQGRLGRWFYVETWEDQKRQFLMAVEQEKVMLIIVLSFIVMLGGFLILATLTLTVVEKTRDIGIVAALGASRSGILSIFLFNGLLIGLFGAALGLGLGRWFVLNVDAVHDFIKYVTGRDVFPPTIYRFRTIPTVWHWPSVFVIMAGSVGVAFFAGLLPALRAARLDPIKALRYE